MTTPTTMEERFEEKFGGQSELSQAILSALEYRGFYDAGKYLDDDISEKIAPIIISFIQSEIDLAVEKREKEIVEEIKDGVGYGKFGFSRLERMYEGQIAINMEDIINLITKK